MKKIVSLFGAGILMLSATAFASSLTVKMYKMSKQGNGAYVGNINFADTKQGILIEPRLFDLAPGKHGLHIHEKPSCANMGKAAGDHLDPLKTGKHLGPINATGHLGDLPTLMVARDGKAHKSLLAPRLTVKDLKGHSIMIHLYGDNYSDQPELNGGGGPRYVCGVAK